jgi:3-hydroxyacyl-CoA dehydrogenase
MKAERALFEEVLRSPESQAQRYVFFAERQVWKLPDIADTTPTRPIRSVGIVGAGTMGGGIAMNFANIGLPVTVVEAKREALERGLTTVRKNYEHSVKRGRLAPEDVDQRMSRIRGSLELRDLADCDLIIEAVYENLEVKQEVFAQLDPIAKDDAILATNTSGLDIDAIADVTRRPESVLGLHFFSPANVMRLLEVVRAQRTASAVIATAMQLAKKIGKVAVLARVCPGFIGNRILFARQRQAEAMLLEGALPWQIDAVLYDFGLPMGPFAMADLAGLDLGWRRETSRSATIREVLCERDRRGQKTGAGYYDYDEQRTARPSPVTEQIVMEFSQRAGIQRRALSEQEILERCLYPMINEGAKILEEGIALRASDIDIVWVNGYGWPAYRGGPMYYADSIGLDRIVAKLDEYAPKLGVDAAVSPLLRELAAAGKKFADWKRAA